MDCSCKRHHKKDDEQYFGIPMQISVGVRWVMFSCMINGWTEDCF